eukprot:7996628-Pyramimonas_sp.AAC.1
MTTALPWRRRSPVFTHVHPIPANSAMGERLIRRPAQEGLAEEKGSEHPDYSGFGRIAVGSTEDEGEAAVS